MKKNFTILMLLAFCCLGMNAKTVTDVLTPTSMGLSSGFEQINGITIKDGSSAQYNVFLSKHPYNDDVFYFRTKESTHGIVTSKSGGIAKKVTVSWYSSSNGNSLDIYASKTPYTNPAQLFGSSKGTYIGKLTHDTKGEKPLSINIPGEYTYIGLRSADGAIYFYNISIEWEAEDEPVTFTPAAGEVKAGTEVVMECEEGAEIYYTLDGSTPTTSSTLYTEPIVINEDVVIKAISCKDDVVSKVVTAEYTVIPVITSLADLANKSDGYRFQMGIELTITYCGSALNYVYDGTSYSIIFPDTYSYWQPGDVIESGWVGKVKYVNGDDGYYMGRPQLVPEDNLVYGEKTAAIPEPTVVTDAYEVNAENVNQYFKLKHVYIDSYYLDDAYLGNDYDGLMFGRYFTLNSNPFWVYPTEEGTYDITGFVDIYYGQPKFHAIKFDAPYDIVKIGESKIATFCSEFPRDFEGSGVKAYIATKTITTTDGSSVVLEEVTKVPAGVGVILMSDVPDTYDVPSATSATIGKTNYLIGTKEETTVKTKDEDT